MIGKLLRKLGNQPTSWLSALKDRMLLGIVVGLFFATGCSAYALISFIIRGNAAFRANGTTLGAAIAVYYGGFILSGVLFGLLLPLARWRISAAFVGFVAMVPFYGAVMVALSGISNWGPVQTITTILGALFVGMPVGLYFWARLS